MARVNRTTGVFLILGVVALIGTVAGARWLIPADSVPRGVEPPTEMSVHTSGYVDSATGLSVLVPNVPGRVVAVHVKEGDVVQRGQVLVQLDDKAQRDQLVIAEQALATSKAKLADAKHIAREQIKAHQVKLDQFAHLLVTAKADLEKCRIEYEAARKLVESRLDSSAEHKLQLATIAVQQAKMNVEAAEKQLAKHKEIDPAPSLREPEEALKEAELRVKAARDLLDAYQIKAPSDGQVFEINYQVGGSAPLPMGDPNASRALVFCPQDSSLVVRAEINQEWALMVRPGMKAVMTFQGADRDYRWTGTVEKVASYIQRRRSRVMEPDSFNDTRTRECIIRMDPDSNAPAVPGLRVNVQIVTGTSR